MIKTQPATYRTSDGLEFSDLESAEIHQECATALRELQEAESKFFTKLAAKHYLTADGRPFSLQTANWVIVERQYEPPYVAEVELAWQSSQSRYYFREDGALCISWRRGKEEHRRPVTDFYHSEKAARLAVIEMRKKHLDWWLADLKEAEEKVQKLRD